MLPQITSHLPSSTVHSRFLLATGDISPAPPNTHGDIWITAHNFSFPAQTFPVRNCAFKALLHLVPGENTLTLDFRPSPSAIPPVTFKSVFYISYLPLLQNPPLHLAIIVGADSPLRYDDVAKPSEPATLETAIKKLRVAGYLWQAYTGSEMNTHGLGHRTFRLDEAWLPDSLSRVDSPRRNTAKVTVLRSKHPVAHIRSPERAQQNRQSEADKSLFDIALEAIHDYPEFRRGGAGEKLHVAAMFLDSTYDRGKKLITGHAALGSEEAGGVALAIFGSHSLFAWPSCVEAVVPAFNDTRPVDTKHCGVDVEGSTYWMAANVGIGAFLHECGHLFGCPHQSSGVMQRDYTRLHRSFSVIEPQRTTSDCHWHRLDALRFLRHPSFSLPSDPVAPPGAISALATPTGVVISSTASPITLIEFHTPPSSETPTTVLEPRKQTLLLPYTQLRSDTKLLIFTASPLTSPLAIDSTATLSCTRVDAALGTVYRTQTMGAGKGQTYCTPVPHPLRCIRVHCGAALDGIEFFGPGATGVLFGKRGGSPKDFIMAQGEELRGFAVRSGAWVDAVSVVTDQRRGEWWGGNGGGVGEMIVPAGCKVAAVVGEVGRWVLGMGLEYAPPQLLSTQRANDGNG